MGKLTAENPASIREMFGIISRKYDLVNSVLSFGIHHYWKKKLIREGQVKPHDRILDCATGTGDLAFLFEAKLKGTGQVIGSDFCQPMLDIAKNKAQQKNSRAQFDWADVMNLHYSDHQFNLASISFGIRNVADTKKALSELGRVVQPQGRVLVLEFGQPRSRIMAALFGFYSRFILPLIGGWMSGEPNAYRYLQTSSAAFPCGEAFLKIAEATGKYSRMRYIPLQSGIAYLYILDRK